MHQAIAGDKGQTAQVHVRRVTARTCNVRPVTLTAWSSRRGARGLAASPMAMRKRPLNSGSAKYFCRGELSQLTVKRQAVDGPAVGFDNRLFVE